MDTKRQAFELFAKGSVPEDPEVQALNIKKKTLREYWRLFLKGQTTSRSFSLTNDPSEAVIVAISPKRFETTSTLLWQGREAAIREWGWPKDITIEDFLDTFIYCAFKERGIILGGYVVQDNQRR
jgi:hypothetical protein